MKAADARAMTVDQLDDEVLKLKKEQFNLRFQRATGQLENTSRVREVRRDIARMLTIASRSGPATSRGQGAEQAEQAERSRRSGPPSARPEIQIEAELKSGPRRRSRRSKRIVCRSERSRAWLSATSRTRP